MAIFEKRYLFEAVSEDLRKKMVFVGGPRQVGKTTFALSLLKNGSKTHPAYFNWDIQGKRQAMREGIFPPHEGLLIYDEVHKFARWRGLMKGLFDQYGPEKAFLVTGSARLDHYRKGGDSLQGRYHYYRLHPFSAVEASSHPTRNDIDQLLQLGGFPEPFLSGSEKTLRRWQKERLERVIYEDVRDLEQVKEISLIETLTEDLPRRIGSPLSVKSVREDLGVAHETAERWITILENLYVVFRIAPYGTPKIRAVKKEQKLYCWDWAQVSDEGARFENLVACQLLKFCHFVEDTEGHRMELRYLRDTDKREIDFVVLKDQKPIFAVECKRSETTPTPAAQYFRERSKIPKFFQVHLGNHHVGDENKAVRIMPFHLFCQELRLP